MSLQFILGGPRSGSSALLRNNLIASALAHPDRRHVILVPEQFTLQTQRDIVAAHPRHAVMNIEILSFERLAYRVLEGRAGELRILTEMGKNMLLRRAAGLHREELVLYRKSLNRPGFIQRLMSMLSEFWQYGVTEEDLERMQRETADHPLLSRKLKELEVFSRALSELRGPEEIAAEELLSVCLRVLPENGFLRHAVVALDYFTGFTPVQRDILRELMKQADQVSAAFLLPEEEDASPELRESELFYMSRLAVIQLEQMAAECGIASEKVFAEEGGSSRELAFLARHFLRYGKKEEAFFGEHRDISVALARNPREEARYAAVQIARMVREEGYRYREIAVVTGDLETYRVPLTQELSRAGIPWFCDRKKGVLGNPLVEYLRSAMDVVAQDFSYESVFRHLRCGLSGIPEEEIDRLDLYVFSAGIRGRKRWEETWTWDPDARRPSDLEALNRTRCAVTESLRCLEDLKGAAVAERTAVLRQMMERIHAEEEMESRSELLRQAGDPERAEEYARITGFLNDLLDQMDGLLGGERMSREEFSDILEAGLSGARIGLLPTGLDQVQIGDVRRSRLTEVRALIVVGMNDGMMPGAPASGGILTEWERTLLREKKMELAPAAEPAAGQERFYLYRLFTRPSERLLLSASRMNGEGQAARPSYLLTHLLKVFPDLPVENLEQWNWADQIAGREGAWGAAAGTLREHADRMMEGKGDPDYRDLLLALTRPDGEERFARILSAAFHPYEGDSLTKAAAKALYGPELTGSVTRMEEYASCAARHFLDYGLRLAERKPREITGNGRGSFFHKVLQMFFREMKDRGLDPADMSEELRQEMVKQALERASEEDAMIRITEESASGKFLYRRWEKLADQMIWTLCQQLMDSGFRPEAFELKFSGWNASALQTELADGIRLVLTGTVDRLDVLEENGVKYLRIVDYKTGTKKFDLNEVWQGLSLQLLVYMDAVTELQKRQDPEREVIPAGMYYQTVKETLLDAKEGQMPEALRSGRLREARLAGLTNAAKDVREHTEDVKGLTAGTDQIRALIRHVSRQMAQFGQEIADGNISANPWRRGDSTSCTYCPYASVCGFDPKTEGYRYRRIRAKKDREILEMLAAEEDDNEVDG